MIFYNNEVTPEGKITNDRMFTKNRTEQEKSEAKELIEHIKYMKSKIKSVNGVQLI